MLPRMSTYSDWEISKTWHKEEPTPNLAGSMYAIARPTLPQACPEVERNGPGNHA